MKHQFCALDMIIDAAILFCLQEREFALAAGKVAECQSTIASISRQLKSLADFDLMLESGETELDDEENLNIPNGLRPSSAFSPLPEFEKCLSPSRNYMHIRSH